MDPAQPVEETRFLLDLLRLAFNLVVHLFFRRISVRGLEYVPRSGPVLFVAGPHSNQFVDAMLLLVHIPRYISFLIAKASYDRPLVGFISKILRSIPVERPQDLTKFGTGSVMLDCNNPAILIGSETKFTLDVNARSTLSISNTTFKSLEVAQVLSDTKLVLAQPIDTSAFPDSPLLTSFQTFKVTPYVDQSEMMSDVQTHLIRGGCVGIFPEGGSHDRTEMLPLKAGVALLALGTVAATWDPITRTSSTDVKIVPTGLCYFHPHKFRSTACIEIGPPIKVRLEWVEAYIEGGPAKREAVAALLRTILKALRGVTVQVPDYSLYQVVHTAKNLYLPDTTRASPLASLELMRKFIRGFIRNKEDCRVQVLTQKIQDYNRLLSTHRIKDQDLKSPPQTLRGGPGINAAAVFVSSLTIIGVVYLLSLPGLIVNAPVLVLASTLSMKKAKEAKAKSSVKIRGYDVLATWKIMVASAVYPIVNLFYSLVLVLIMTCYLPADSPNKLPLLWCVAFPFLFFVALPLLTVCTILLTDIGQDTRAELRPLILSLTMPKDVVNELQRMRAGLRAELREVIAAIDDALLKSGSGGGGKGVLQDVAVVMSETPSSAPSSPGGSGSAWMGTKSGRGSWDGKEVTRWKASLLSDSEQGSCSEQE